MLDCSDKVLGFRVFCLGHFDHGSTASRNGIAGTTFATGSNPLTLHPMDHNRVQQSIGFWVWACATTCAAEASRMRFDPVYVTWNV